MKPLETVFAFVACLSPLAAQAVTASLTALTPVTVQVSDGASTDSNSWPAGPLPNYVFSVAASLTGSVYGAAAVGWSVISGDSASVVRITHEIVNPSGSTSFSGRAGPNEFLVEFAAAVPVTANLRLTRWADLSAGAPWPRVQVDFGNDGVIDVADLSTTQGASLVPSFGPQPLRVRLIVDANLGSELMSSTVVGVVLTPENNLTITPVVASCNPGVPAPPPFVQPSFQNRGIDLSLAQQLLEPSLLVLGFGAQPVLLSLNASLPCILLPTPDIVIFEPSGIRNVPLPASLRPLTFFVQGVTLAAPAWLTTDGSVVTAF
ncbi:MAG: hypothetical protein MUC36_03300 [Planctomycetes bacterium]|jgi:hypothetical protein|nr:hypothetical protein [Planctomycetota bacterium]